jgi:glutamate formiminotransferase / 5-formyltetrahydrofolate cyclo-ligase
MLKSEHPMNQTILWSAINISEGRDLEALQSLAFSLQSEGAQLADWSADTDHHRSVFSLVGSATQLSSAIEAVFRWAEQHIDLSRHAGEHPRLGAVDVVPFVPLSANATVESAHQVAESTAQFISQKFNIPSFLYRDSSQGQNPLTLPELRRGGLGRLGERMRDGTLKADFGPSEPHPQLGVTVFGARTPLVAFNCVLNTTNIEVGQQIAREIRASNGGTPHLQALAFQLESQGGAVQISMNILNPQETPPHIAYLAVCEASRKRALEVVSSELVGMLPLDSLEQAFCHFLKLDSFHTGQIAEWNLYSTHATGETGRNI